MELAVALFRRQHNGNHFLDKTGGELVERGNKMITVMRKRREGIIARRHDYLKEMPVSHVVIFIANTFPRKLDWRGQLAPCRRSLTVSR